MRRNFTWSTSVPGRATIHKVGALGKMTISGPIALGSVASSRRDGRIHRGNHVSDTDPVTIANQIIDGEVDLAEHPLTMGGEARLTEVCGGTAFIEAFGNVSVVATDDGLVVVDGSSIIHAPGVVAATREWSADPVHSGVITHGHVDHIAAFPLFDAGQDPPMDLIAHDAVPDRFRRYERTNGYNATINQRQFQLAAPWFPDTFPTPTSTYGDEMTRDVGGVRFEMRHDRGETDDSTWVWIPARRVLCTGDLFIWASPNCGNPQKAQRYCDEWAVALRKMADLGAEYLLPGHGMPISGEARIRGVLLDTATYLQSIFDQTIEMMNAGCRLDEIVHTVRPAAEVTDRPWLQPIYDEPEFVVRGIWRLYGGWYDGNPAHLKPPADAALAGEVAALAGGADVLVERALALSAAGEHRLATSLIEMASMAAPDRPDVTAARGRVFGARKQIETSTMAKGVYAWAEHESDGA